MMSSTASHGGIAIAGTVLVDTICEIEAYPASGELAKIRRLHKALGGCVPNVALDLKTMSPSLPVHAIGNIGADSNGELVRRTLADAGITCHLNERAEEPTSFTQVMSIPGGQRTFFTYAGADASFGIRDLDFNTLDIRMLHLGYLLLLDTVDNGDGVAILREATRRGIKTSIDLVSENSNRYAMVLPCLPHTDYLIVNEIEAGALAGMEPTDGNLRAIAEKLRALGVREKVIIHRRDCAVCLSNSGFSVIGSLEVPSSYMQGSTGAGDAFCAAALLSLYENASDTEILTFASAAAAVSLGSADATSGLTTKEKICNISKEWKRVSLCW